MKCKRGICSNCSSDKGFEEKTKPWKVFVCSNCGISYEEPPVCDGEILGGTCQKCKHVYVVDTPGRKRIEENMQAGA